MVVTNLSSSRKDTAVRTVRLLITSTQDPLDVTRTRHRFVVSLCLFVTRVCTQSSESTFERGLVGTHATLQVLDPSSLVNHALRAGAATVAAGLTSSLPMLVPPTLDDMSVVSANVEEAIGEDYTVMITLEIVVNAAESDEESSRRRRSLLASGSSRRLAQTEESEVRTYDGLAPVS